MATYRVLVAGSALARDAEAVRNVIQNLQEIQPAMGKLLEVVTDDYPSGATPLALQACLDLGVHHQAYEETDPRRALDKDARWAYFLTKLPVDLIVLVWHGEPLEVPGLRQAAENQDPPVPIYEIQA